MKNSIISVLVLMLISVSSYGQAQFALGIKVGPNFANIDTKSSVGANYSNRTGFHGGAFALFKLTKIGIQPEIIFSQQGSTIEINGKDFEENFSYVNIPVILKFYLVAGLNLQAGPQFGFLTKAEGIEFDAGGDPTDGHNVKDQFKGSDISVGLGAGWDLPFGLTIDARYNLGISEINDSAGSEAVKNQVFQLSLGYKFIKIGK